MTYELISFKLKLQLCVKSGITCIRTKSYRFAIPSLSWLRIPSQLTTYANPSWPPIPVGVDHSVQPRNQSLQVWRSWPDRQTGFVSLSISQLARLHFSSSHCFAHGLTFRRQPMGLMHHAIQDGVSHSRVREESMPLVGWVLRCDEQWACSHSTINHI